MTISSSCDTLLTMATIDEFLKDFEPNPAMTKFRNKLDQIQAALDAGETLDMKLTKEILSGQPVLQVGVAMVTEKGYGKPKVIENFIGQMTIGLALDFITGQIPS
jgi:hypothetical protein